jgi:hypothetical protein
MRFIEYIHFNAPLYATFPNWFFLLYEWKKHKVAIPAQNADLLSFIQYFDNIQACFNRVGINAHTTVTLFAYLDDMKDWLLDYINIPENLREVNIFCHSADREYANGWIKRYMHRFRATSFQIIESDKLNYNLLLFGVNRLKQLHADSPVHPDRQEQMHRHYKRICHVLANHFWQEANRENL